MDSKQDKKGRKGEEIELEYTGWVADVLNLPRNGKAIFRFTGEFIQEYNEQGYYLHNGEVWHGYGVKREPNLEFVRQDKKGYQVGDTFVLKKDECCSGCKDWAGEELIVDRIDYEVHKGEMHINKTNCLDSGGFEYTNYRIGYKAPIIHLIKKGYQIGDEFIYHTDNEIHTAYAWNGMKCKLVRIDNHTGKYEMIMQHKDYPDEMSLDGSGYPNGFEWAVKSEHKEPDLNVVRCIDPHFWIKELGNLPINISDAIYNELNKRSFRFTGKNW